MGAVHDHIVIGDEVYDLPAGRGALRDELLRRFPRERAAIDTYFERVDAAVRASRGYFTEKALPPFVAKIGGGLMRRRFLAHASPTTRSVLEELTDDQSLIAVLTGQYFAYGLPPAQSSFAVHAIVAAHYFEGGFYPVGGASRIAETIVPVSEQAGGAVVTRAPFDRILVERGRAVGVRLESGAEYRAPVIVSAAGVPATYERLLAKDVVDAHALSRFGASLQPSTAHVCLYVGLRGTAEDLSLERANYFVYPSADHDGDLAA